MLKYVTFIFGMLFFSLQSEASIYNNYSDIKVVNCNSCSSNSSFESVALSSLSLNKISLVVVTNDNNQTFRAYHGQYEAEPEMPQGVRTINPIYADSEIAADYAEYNTLKASGNIKIVEINYPKNETENKDFYSPSFNPAVWVDYGTYARSKLKLSGLNIFIIHIVTVKFSDGSSVVLRIDPRSTITQLIIALDAEGKVILLTPDASTSGSTSGGSNGDSVNIEAPLREYSGGFRQVIGCTGSNGKMVCHVVQV